MDADGACFEESVNVFEIHVDVLVLDRDSLVLFFKEEGVFSSIGLSSSSSSVPGFIQACWG